MTYLYIHVFIRLFRDGTQQDAQFRHTFVEADSETAAYRDGYRALFGEDRCDPDGSAADYVVALDAGGPA